LFKHFGEQLTNYVSAIKVNEIWQDNLPHLLDEKNRRTELCHGLASAAKAFNSWSSHLAV